jgi:hypothetical protein
VSFPLMLALGGVYAAFFWTLAMRSPRWALTLIFAVAPFQNDISGGGPLKFSLAEINLFLSLPVVLYRSRRLIFGPTLLPALAYLAVCAFSILGQWRPSTPQSFVQTAIYIVVLVTVFASFAQNEEDYRLPFQGLIAVSMFLAVSVFATGSSYVYNLHKNGVGAFLGVGSVIALEFWLGSPRQKVRWYYLSACVLLAAGCMITVSRGAWMAAIAGMLIVLGLRRRLGLAIKCSVLLIPLLAVVWRFLPESSRQYATSFEGQRWNIQARYQSIDYAMEMFYSNPFQGVGIGLRKDYDATNVILLSLAETGVPGLTTFLLLNGSVAYLVIGSYRRVPRQQVLAKSILALALALTLGKLMHGLVDHYWGRGTLTAAWATVGMAARVAREQRLRRRRQTQEALMQAYAAREVQQAATTGEKAPPTALMTPAVSVNGET